jgi:hypothetical protein
VVHFGRGIRALINLSDNFLEQILERHDASGATVLVDDDDHLRSFTPHGREDIVERRGLGDERQRPRVRALDRFAVDERPQQVFDVHHADDVIEIAFVDREASVRRFAE